MGKITMQELGSDLNTKINNIATKAEQSYVEDTFTAIGNGSPKGTYATLVALQAAYPTGAVGIYVVVADGHWYYWNGSAWTDGGVYQSTSIADRDVTERKTSFVKSINMFDKSNYNTVNAYCYSDKNAIFTVATNKSIYIPCLPNKTYLISSSVVGAQFRAYTLTSNPETLSGTVVAINYANQVSSQITIATTSGANYLLVWVITAGDTVTLQQVADELNIVDQADITAGLTKNAIEVTNLEFRDSTISQSKINGLTTSLGVLDAKFTNNVMLDELIDNRIGSDATLYINSGSHSRAIGGAKGITNSSIKRQLLSSDIFTDISLDVYSADISSTFGSDKAAPIQLRVNLVSSILIDTILVNFTVKNKLNIDSFRCKATISSITSQSSLSTVSGCNELSQLIDTNQTSNTFLLYLWGVTDQSTAKFDIENLRLVINNNASITYEIVTPTIAFATGTVTKTTYNYDAIAKKDDIGADWNWSQKKWLIFGDSISDDDYFATKSHYYDTINALTGIDTMPYAVGGSCYNYNSTVTQAISTWGATNNVLHQIDTYTTTNPDFVSIEAGTNGWGFSAYSLGSVSDILLTNNTFYSLVAQSIRKVKTLYPYSKLFIMTLLPRSDVAEYRTKTNVNSNTMEDFNNAIRTVCTWYSVPMLDMYKLSQLHSDELQPNWWDDSLHPSELYQTTIFANLVYKFMQSI